ncbi:hypothetical protein Micbo1qcDRAFT_169776, partial [Microdochium bolleyi]
MPSDTYADPWQNDYEWPVHELDDYESPQIPAARPANDGQGFPETPSIESQTSVTSKLPLIRLEDWVEGKSYDENPPTCIHYSIEWKLTVDGRVVPGSKDSEQNLVLAPGDYWEKTLRSKLDKLSMKKLASNRSYRPDDTTVVVHVQDRSERDFVKRFDELDIEWSILEQQLLLWSNLFRAGRRLRIEITFNYIQTSGGAGVTTKRGTKRGFASTSERMLAQRDMHLTAEEGSSGQPSICQQVYATFRCPGPPCHVGPYCWQDKDTKKRYRLKTHHFKALIEHVEQGGTLLDHDDVPSSLREQLFAEDQQRLEEQQRKATSRASCPPISITNIMPNA